MKRDIKTMILDFVMTLAAQVISIASVKLVNALMSLISSNESFEFVADILKLLKVII
jgi:hypothetical protein